MLQATDYEQQILQGIKGLPQHYLDEVVDFVYFLRQKRTKQNQLENPISERKQAMLDWVADNRQNAPKIDASINIRALIDETHDIVI